MKTVVNILENEIKQGETLNDAIKRKLSEKGKMLVDIKAVSCEWQVNGLNVLEILCEVE